jgi:hypothetical protein
VSDDQLEQEDGGARPRRAEREERPVPVRSGAGGGSDAPPAAAAGSRRAAALVAAQEAASRKRWFQLVPRRNLVRVGLMVFILLVVIALQRRTGSIVANLEAVLGVRPARPPATAREAPRVRLAPLPQSPAPGTAEAAK